MQQARGMVSPRGPAPVDATALIEAARLTAPWDAHAGANLLTRALSSLPLEHPSRHEVVLELLPLASWGGRPREAERLARESLSQPDQIDDRELRGHLATALALQDRWNEACSIWSELLDASSPSAEDHWKVAAEHAAALAFCRRLDDSRRSAQEVLEHADEDDAHARYCALQAISTVLFFEGRYGEATDSAIELVKLMEADDDLGLQRRNPYMIYGFMLSATGRIDEAKNNLEAAAALARDTGALWAVPANQWYLGHIYFREGDWDRAAAEFDKGLASSDMNEGTWETASLLGNYAVLEARRGDFASALGHLERFAVMDELNLADRGWDALARALIAEGEGRTKDAFEELLAIWTEADRDDVLQMMLGMLPDIVRLAVDIQDTAFSSQVVEKLEKVSALGSPEIGTLAAHAGGVVESDEILLERAIAGHATRRHLLEEALAWEELAVVWARKSRRRKAMVALREAIARFDRMGAHTDSRRMRARLRGYGVSAPPPTADDLGDGAWGTLTRTEKAVALLVAEGLRNKEIASRMFVTVQTVETHLKKIFRKLGATSRSQVVREVLHRTEESPETVRGTP
jgi:DNA-binding CsgD family transcriptional regulator